MTFSIWQRGRQLGVSGRTIPSNKQGMVSAFFHWTVEEALQRCLWHVHVPPELGGGMDIISYPRRSALKSVTDGAGIKQMIIPQTEIVEHGIEDAVEIRAADGSPIAYDMVAIDELPGVTEETAQMAAARGEEINLWSVMFVQEGAHRWQGQEALGHCTGSEIKTSVNPRLPTCLTSSPTPQP